MTYRVLDLFCGAAGGWSLGLHRAGLTTIAACEIDPWRREQYSRNFPNVRMYADVRELTAERLHADGLVPDIIVGSPPCQDASTANTKGKGVDGERTGLFFEALRLVRELRPRWVCLENVPGIRNRGVDRVLDALGSAGYAFWPLVVGASDLGANHVRKRLVLVAKAADADERRRGSWQARAIWPRWLGMGAGARPDGAHAHVQGQHAGAGDARGEMAWGAGIGGDAANADANSVWHEPGRRGRQNGTRSTIALVDGPISPDADQIRRERLSRPERQPRAEAQFGAGSHWAASAPDFGRMDAWIPERLADFCRLKCEGDLGWLIREIAILRNDASFADSVLSDADLAVALKIIAGSSRGDIAQKAAQTALRALRLLAFADERGNTEEIVANAAAQLNGFMRIIGMRTCLTTILKTSKRSAPPAICAITGKHAQAARDGQGCRGANGAIRACIAAYGDAFIPQAAELVGRAILHVDSLRSEAA